jgi:heme oxygenase
MNTQSEPLAISFRKATRNVHSVSDHLINSKLALALLDRQGVTYGRALALFQPVYATLRSLHQKHAEHAVLKRLPLRTSDVGAQMLLDCKYFGVTGAEEAAACRDYVAHLQQLSDTAPHLLCAHIYTMNMALLAGGRIIAKLVKASLHVDDQHGLATFRLDADEDAVKLRDAFRAGLNQIGTEVDAATREQLVAEAQHVFRLNNALVAKLRLRWWRILLGFMLQFNGIPALVALLILGFLLKRWVWSL